MRSTEGWPGFTHFAKLFYFRKLPFNGGIAANIESGPFPKSESSTMKTERPVVVLVFAILNLIFGGLALLGYFCGGIGLIFMVAIFSNAPAGPSFPPLPSGLIALFVVLFFYGFIMAGVLILSGIGLLSMKPWARKAAIIYSVITIVYALIAFVINITYVGPVMQRWQDEFQEE